MKNALITVLVGILTTTMGLPANADKDSERPEPRLEIEMVWADVRAGKVDLFLLVTNPNDFDVYVSTCGSSATDWVGVDTGSTAFADGPAVCSDSTYFTVVPARSKRLKRWGWIGTLDPGPNRFHVKTSGYKDPALPWNYVVVEGEFDFVVVNPDTLSR